MEVIDMNLEYDLARICRCCRRDSPDLQPIFLDGAAVADGTTLYEMLASCTQSQPNFNDGLPPQLCGDCVSEVTTAYGFRKRYEQSELLLREYLSRRKVEPAACGVKVEELFDVKTELIVVETVGEEEDELMTVEFVEESGEDEDQDYEDHMAVEHPGEALVEPKKTERSERELALTLTAELLEDPGKMEAICRICDATFERIAELRRHLRTHEDVKSFENVNIANKPYLFEEGYVLENYLEYLVQQVCKGNLLRFYQIVEPDGEELELSDSDTDGEDEEVVRREHGCGLCQQSFARIKLLREHAKSCHRPEELIGCKHCARGFPNTTLFMRHLRQQCENTVKKFHCTFCNEKFMWQTSLNKHAQHHHKPTKPLWERPGDESGTSAANEESAKKFVCQVCTKGFQRLEHLERHIKIHIPSEKKFECPVCHKKFNRKDNLRSHLKIHQKDPDADTDPAKQNQLCVYCGRGFSNSSNLIVHMRRHTGERPYRCDICDKGFPRSSDLQCHRRTHTGEKPCLCTICGKGFSRSNKLVRHM
ncbi:zinc finger protein 136, partial [Culex quinquefasciatus]